MLAEGNKILINGKEYTLGAKLGGGKEGSVFDLVEKKGAVVKIINDSTMSKIQRNELYAHLKWLYNLGRQADKKELRQYMALPLGLLDDELGYAMLKAGEHDPLNKYITVPEIDGEFDAWYREKYTLKKRYQIIVNLFDALRKIHLSGLIFTDLSPNNIMVHQKQNQIVFIDTDNTRKRTDSYLSVLGTPGYMAPEVYRKPDMKLAKENNIDPKLLANSGRITTESDIFSAAVIAFQLLALWHPFIGDEIEEGTPEDEERALEIKTDYIFKAGTSNTCSYALVPQFEELTTPEIRRLFERTFVDGKDQPALRPTAEEFLEAFQNAFDMIVECPSCGFSRIRADSIEQVVIAELQTIARFLDEEEEAFATLLESKTNKDIATEQKLAESSLATARARVKEIERLYEKIYEDNVNGKVSDEWFMKLSHKYEVEMDETKKNILALREKLDSLAEKRQTKENFVKAVRSFMEMKTLNPVILRELIEKIEVYQIEGTGKNRTQRVVIHYRFVGCLQIPEWHRKRKITLESRQGVAVNYLPTTA